MLPVLTNRENELLKLIADGLTNGEKSCYLAISESTVIEGILHDRIRDKFHNSYAISTFINCHNFDYFSLFAVMKLIQSLLQRELKCYPL